MRIINVLIIITYLISIVFIPIALFCISLETVFGAIGYSALILGGLLTLIKIILTKRVGRK